MNDKSNYTYTNYSKGCDCNDGTYNIKCCKGNPLDQMIGSEYRKPKLKGDFSNGFSNGFSNVFNIK